MKDMSLSSCIVFLRGHLESPLVVTQFEEHVKETELIASTAKTWEAKIRKCLEAETVPLIFSCLFLSIYANSFQKVLYKHVLAKMLIYLLNFSGYCLPSTCVFDLAEQFLYGAN